MIKIESLEHLKQMCLDNKSEYFIKLGPFRSSKHIEYSESDDNWWIYNEIDDSEDTLTSEQMMDNQYTNIGDAINKGCFYYYD